LEIPHQNITKEGNYEETVLFKDYIAQPYGYNAAAYNTFLRGDHPYLKITNYQPIEKKKILWVKDSFSRHTSTFASLYFEEVHLYDLRHGSREDFIEKLEEIEPDIVVCMYNPNQFGGTTLNFLPDPVETN
jgi:hypothetical protein